jgi:copper transport protein
VTIDPARVGINTIHVYTLTPKGADLNVRDMSAKLVSADGSTSVPANLVRAGPNHFLTNDATIPDAGTYKMEVQVLQVKDGLLVPSAGVLTVPIR